MGFYLGLKLSSKGKYHLWLELKLDMLVNMFMLTSLDAKENSEKKGEPSRNFDLVRWLVHECPCDKRA